MYKVCIYVFILRPVEVIMNLDPESCRWKCQSGLAALGVGHPDKRAQRLAKQCTPPPPGGLFLNNPEK